jgi:hypothetical protein
MPFLSMSFTVELAITIFSISNCVRVVAYVPQILQVIRDREGATAVSCMTWLLFSLSHLSTVVYALLVIGDWRMAVIFLANLLCCLTIISLTVYKRTIVGRRARLLPE